MKITINPNDIRNLNSIATIPPHLQKFVTDWSDAKHQNFSFGSMLSQQYICRHYSVYMYRLVVNEPVTIQTGIEQPTIALQFTITGTLQTVLSGYYGVEVSSGKYMLVYLPAGIHQVHLKKGITESLHFELGPSWIDDLAATNENVDALLENLKGGSKDPITLPIADIDYVVMHNLTEMLRCKECGADLLMEIKTVIGNLLNLYRKAIREIDYLGQLPIVPHHEQLLRIWNKIKTNPNIHDHSVTQLVRENYLSAKTLTRNFRKMFEADIVRFVQDECMRKAYHLITSTKKPVEEVAIELGYSDVSSFSRAFKRRFNAAPQSIRELEMINKNVH